MSTKTTFKRIALVAVAALGFGVLSVAPSQAEITAVTLTVADGTATTALSDSTTAGTATFDYLSQHRNDTATIAVTLTSDPGGTSTALPRLYFVETLSSSTSLIAASSPQAAGTQIAKGDSVSAGTKYWVGRTDSTVVGTATADTKRIGGSFMVYINAENATLVAGTYVTTVTLTPFTNGVAGTAVAKTVSIVVSTATTASKTASAVYSTLADPTASSAVATVSTSNTEAGYIRLTQKNSSDLGNANESVTVTVTGPGTAGTSTVRGKSVVLAYTAGTPLDIKYWADGTAGTASIAVSVPSIVFPAKTVTFYAKAAKTVDAKVASPVLKVGSNDSAVAVTAVDANGTNWAGQAYIVASAAADALIGGSATTPVACSYQSSTKTHWCPVSTISTGTAKFKVIDASTVALATATSNEVTVTVSASAPSSVKLAFDKATYQPFEKAIIRVTVMGADGKELAGQTFANLFATGGISSNLAFSTVTTAVDLTPVSITTESVDGTDKFAGSKTYVVYMPAAGDVTISAKGGTSLAAAGQVAVSATASVVNSSVDAATDAANEATDAANAATDAALAAADAADAATAAAQDASDAVAALSASVSKLISSLRAQITSLTNLVIKIQKKVRA
jgi:trimeric autotransporter adhesin